MSQVAAVVVAAGQGLRAGGDMPKQFREIGGASLLRRSLLGFASVPAVSALAALMLKEGHRALVPTGRPNNCND